MAIDKNNRKVELDSTRDSSSYLIAAGLEPATSGRDFNASRAPKPLGLHPHAPTVAARNNLPKASDPVEHPQIIYIT